MQDRCQHRCIVHNCVCMAQNEDDFGTTATTLLLRLKDSEDQASWQRFFDTYWRLIYGVARKSGLNDTEAQEVVQETMIAVARQMPSFRYDPTLGSFKSWLLNLTRWRIVNRLRKRLASPDVAQNDAAVSQPEDFIDPASPALNRIWEDEWQSNLLSAALARVKRRLDPAKYQIFDFYVNKELPAEKVAQTFKVSVDKVFLIKHQVTGMLKEELKQLENNPE